MKNTRFAVAVIALSTPSFDVFTAGPVSSTQVQNTNKIGMVSADGATTLGDLEVELAEKADAAGTTSYNVTSTIGRDKVSSTTAIYG